MDKRTAILQATMRLITENGFHGTPMSMVAKEAGVAAGTIYHYFPGKEALINELYATLKQHMGEALLRDDDPQQSYQARFFRFWLNLFYYFTGQPDEFRFLEQYANSPFVTQQAREQNEVFYRPVIEFLQLGISQGELRPLHLALMTAQVYGSVVSAAKLHLSGELELTPALLQTAVQSCFDGVRNP